MLRFVERVSTLYIEQWIFATRRVVPPGSNKRKQEDAPRKRVTLLAVYLARRRATQSVSRFLQSLFFRLRVALRWVPRSHEPCLLLRCVLANPLSHAACIDASHVALGAASIVPSLPSAESPAPCARQQAVLAHRALMHACYFRCVLAAPRLTALRFAGSTVA